LEKLIIKIIIKKRLKFFPYIQSPLKSDKFKKEIEIKLILIISKYLHWKNNVLLLDLER
jgi:hypothetical protein